MCHKPSRRDRYWLLPATLAALLLTLASPVAIAAANGEVYAVKGCKIVPVSSAVIDSGNVVIRDGLIEAVGDVPIPADAWIIDGRGLTAYPGFINTHTDALIKLPREEQPAGQPGTRGRASQAQPQRQREPTDADRGILPGRKAVDLLEWKESELQKWRQIGVTSVLTIPKRGMIPGQSTVINTGGADLESIVVRPAVALHIQFQGARGRIFPATLMGVFAQLRQSFLDAQHYQTVMATYQRSPLGMRRPEFDETSEALAPVLRRREVVIFTVSSMHDIKRAINLAEEYGLVYKLSGAKEAWRVADLLKRKRVPLSVSLDFKPPRTSIYAQSSREAREQAEKEIYPKNAAELHKAGVRFALNSYGLKSADEFLKNLRKAVEMGLPEKAAIEALTRNAAEYLGLGQVLGTLEPGKIANVVLAEDSLFTGNGKIKHVFVDGIHYEIKERKKTRKTGEGAPADIGGTWSLEIDSPHGTMQITATFEVSGSSFSGTMTSDMGTWRITDGSISGNRITFILEGEIGGNPISLPAEAVVEGDEMSGTMDAGEMGQFEFSGTRNPS